MNKQVCERCKDRRDENLLLDLNRNTLFCSHMYKQLFLSLKPEKKDTMFMAKNALLNETKR